MRSEVARTEAVLDGGAGYPRFRTPLKRELGLAALFCTQRHRTIAAMASRTTRSAAYLRLRN
jgi:hypothetical protein